MKKYEKYFILWTISFMVNLYYAIHETGIWEYIGIPIVTLCLIFMMSNLIDVISDKDA